MNAELDALRELVAAHETKPAHTGTRRWLDALAQARKTIAEADAPQSQTPFADHFVSFCRALDEMQSKTSVLAAIGTVNNEQVREEARLARVRVLQVYNEALTAWQTGAPTVAALKPVPDLAALRAIAKRKGHSIQEDARAGCFNVYDNPHGAYVQGRTAHAFCVCLREVAELLDTLPDLT